MCFSQKSISKKIVFSTLYSHKCRRPLIDNCDVCMRASGAAPIARPWPDPTCPGAGAARSPAGKLQRAVARRANSEATCTMACASATRAAHAECTCARAWLRAGLHRPRGADWANPGNSRMKITPALARVALGPRPARGWAHGSYMAARSQYNSDPAHRRF